MIRLLSLCFCLSYASSALAEGLQFFPPVPVAGDVVSYTIAAPLPKSSTFEWSQYKYGVRPLPSFEDHSGGLSKILDTPGTWFVQIRVTYKAAMDEEEVQRTFSAIVEVKEKPSAPLQGGSQKTPKPTAGERKKDRSSVEARKAEQQSADLATSANTALAQAQSTKDPKDFADAADAAKKAAAAQDEVAKKLAAEDHAAQDTFELRDAVVSLLTSRKSQSPGNTDSDFFKNAAVMSRCYKGAIEAANKLVQQQPNGNTVGNIDAVDEALSNELDKLVDAQFPKSSQKLRDQVWRRFHENATTLIGNAQARKVNWKRLETPSNLVLLYEEIQLAIEEAIRAEHEFVANYETVQNYNNSNRDNGQARRKRTLKDCLLGL